MSKIKPISFFVAILSFLFIAEIQADQRYRVAPGDNLYRIGKKFGIPYKDIMSANQLRKTTIYPNQILVIPSSRATSRQPIAQAVPVQRSVSPRIQTRPTPPSSTYARTAPNQSSGGNYSSGNVSPYRNSTTPDDPVEPFVVARKLPTVPPLEDDEDPLGLGYDPNNTVLPKAMPVDPRVIAHRVPTQTSTPQPVSRPRPTQPVTRSFPRSREVPAVAHYPGKPNGTQVLNPANFPMPSFKNPCKPKCSTKKSSSCSSKSYTVSRGDSVWSISRKFGVAPLKLRQANNILFSRIRPGQTLKIPKSNPLWSL